jgi:hypothetical protein
MKKVLLTLAVFGLVAGSTMANAQVIHRVSVGGADICESLGLPTGCDANFSLVATKYADGRVNSQWQDTFGSGLGRIHVAVDCLNVVYDGAVVGGVITHGTVLGQDVTGLRALTPVVDRGTSANDPQDQLSLSSFPDERSCNDLIPNAPWVLTHGQVKVFSDE